MVAAEGGGETNPSLQPNNQRRKPEERRISMTDKELKERIENHAAKLIAAARNMRLEPGLHFLGVYHDDWCDKINGKGPCNCNPETKPLKGL
jgi:hypothetical protein